LWETEILVRWRWQIPLDTIEGDAELRENRRWLGKRPAWLLLSKPFSRGEPKLDAEEREGLGPADVDNPRL